MATDHSEIKEFLRRATSGQPMRGQQLRFDPKKGTFLLASEGAPNPDNVREYTHKDLESFGCVVG